MAQASPASIPQGYSVQEAAAQIIELINARPQSPRNEDIEAIVAKTVLPSLYLREEPALARKHRELMKRGDEANDRATDIDGAEEADLVQLAGGRWARKADLDERDDCTDEAAALAKTAWSTPPRSIADIYTRAEIARYWHQTGPDEKRWAEGDDPEVCDDWGDRCVAELIAAVLGLCRAASNDPEDKPPAAKRITCAGDIDFDPILGSDGKPLSFNYTNVQFADAFCPTIRMAFLLIGRDRAGVREFVRAVTKEDPNGDALMELINNLHIVENKFAAISSFAGMVMARTMAVAEAYGDEQDAKRIRRERPE